MLLSRTKVDSQGNQPCSCKMVLTLGAPKPLLSHYFRLTQYYYSRNVYLFILFILTVYIYLIIYVYRFGELEIRVNTATGCPSTGQPSSTRFVSRICYKLAWLLLRNCVAQPNKEVVPAAVIAKTTLSLLSDPTAASYVANKVPLDVVDARK